MTHSPEPWTYDERYQEVLDANGRVLAIPTGDYKDANGRRIAALSAENARLREALQHAVAAMQGALRSWEDTHDVDQDGDRLIERSDVDSLEMCRIAAAIEPARAALAAQEAP